MLPTPRWRQKPALEHIDGKLHRVVREGVYRAANGKDYRIPVGFETDGGSVPRPLWWWMPPFGDDAEAGYCLHDYCYKFAERLPGDDHGHMSRRTADDLLREAAVAEGLPSARARIIWMGVRAGGWSIWRRYRLDAYEEPEAA